MAPRLKLPENFRVRTFGTSRNSHGIGKYLPASVPTATKTRSPADVPAIGEDVTHISETRLSESLPVVPQFRDLSEATVTSPERPQAFEGASDADGPSGKTKRKGHIASCPRKRRKTSPTTITRRWQEVWACRFAWAEGEFNASGNLTGVVCRSCTTISGRRKIMVPKGDNLEKHEGKRVCKHDGEPLSHLKKGDTYVKSDCKHLQFAKLWAGRKQSGTVAKQLVAGLEGEMRRKGVQFSTLFQILTNGRPMCDYEREQYLLRHLKVKNVPKKHWSETAGWEMSEHLHSCVLSALTAVVRSASFISISADEVTAIDGTSWVGVHVYAVESWERVPHLLHLSCVADSGTASHLTDVIMHALLGEGGLSREDIASRLVSFGADGVSTFQGPKTGVTAQIREKWAPFTLGASCASHRINLVVETLSNYPLVSRLERLCQSLHSYFCRSNKRHSELQKLADLMETKGNKMLRNVETRWISMRSPAQRILSEYKTLLVKMGMDLSSAAGQKPNSAAAKNFDLLADVEVLLSLACFVPMLNTVHCLIKLSQARDVFICDFLQSIKVCQGDLARMFIDQETAFNAQEFKRYNDLVNLRCEELPLQWSEVPGREGALHLLFNFQHAHVWARCHSRHTGEHMFVTDEEFLSIQGSVRRQFAEVAQSLCDELDRRFPQQELLDAFGIIYPQYWQQEGAEESFAQHLLVLKKFYCHSRTLCADQLDGGSFYTVPEMLSESKLDNQQSLFKITMKANCMAACAAPFNMNLVIKLWRTLAQSRHLMKLISEYFKVAEIGCCLVLGSVEDERTFSTLKFLKSCHRNRLGKHLPLVVRMFGQKYYTLENFPYKAAIESWKAAVKVGRHGDI